MQTCDGDGIELRRRWFPICASHDLPAQHVFETELLGEELAVWRGANGSANVWKNRCPHRGVRLTIGANLGSELRCAYHGYRFAQGTGRCTAVPAQRGKVPPQSLCVKIYPAVERDGLVWTRLTNGHQPSEPPFGSGAGVALYSVVVRAPALAVCERLAEYRFRPSGALGDPAQAGECCVTSRIDAYRFRSVANSDSLLTEVYLSTQPVDAQCTVIHGTVTGELAEPLRRATLKHHARQLNAMRDLCEQLD